MSKNPQNKRWLLLIAGILVAAGVAAGVYYFVLNKSDNTPDTDDEEEVVKDKDGDEVSPVTLQTEEEILAEFDDEEEIVYEIPEELLHSEKLPIKVEFEECVPATPDEEFKAQRSKIDDYAVGSEDDYEDDHVYRMEENVIVEEKKVNEEEMIFAVVEQMPSFPGGDNALRDYLSKNLKYPAEAEEKGIHGRVVCQFVVERDGSISGVKVVRGVDPDLDREAVRVIKFMPKFHPGYQNGKAVRVSFTMPVNFLLQ